MEIVRQYKNASEEDLRIDEIQMTRKNNPISKDKNYHVFNRRLKTRMVYGATDRVVAKIEIIGDFSSIETSSSNYTWAKWTSPEATCDMSDLPIVTDTI